MKINKAKLLVGTLAIASVAATVGSISGTVAWFQYNTRSTVEYSAATAHCTENLQIRLYDSELIGESKKPYASETKWDEAFPWSADLTSDMINKYIKVKRGAWNDEDSKWDEKNDTNLYPVTSGALASGVATKFYKSPIYQYSGAYATDWHDADLGDYVVLPIQLRVLDRNGEGDDFLAKNVYLSDLTLHSSATRVGKKDVTKALRVSFEAGDTKVTFSADGGNTIVSGKLDLNADGKVDKATGYTWENPADFVYGKDQENASGDDLIAVSTALTKATSTDPTYIANDTNPLKIVGNALGEAATASPWLSVTVKIYLEGWQTLDLGVTSTATEYADLAAMNAAKEGGTFTGTPGTNYKTADNNVYKYDGTAFTLVPTSSAVWDDSSFVGSTFDIGMRFSADAHTDH